MSKIYKEHGGSIMVENTYPLLSDRYATEPEQIAFEAGITDTDDVPYEILERAIRDYPKGVEFRSACNDSIATSSGIFELGPILHNILCYTLDIKEQKFIYYNNKWAEIIPKSKFKIGDKVEVVSAGLGCSISEIGTIVEITDIGVYDNGPGYVVSPPIGNCTFSAFIGENSFELVSDTLKVEDMIKGEYYTFNCSLTGRWIIKFDSLDNGFLNHLGSFCRDSNSFYNNNSWGHISTISDLKLATREEIKEFENACNLQNGYKIEQYKHYKISLENQWVEYCLDKKNLDFKRDSQLIDVDKLVNGKYYHCIDKWNRDWIIHFNKIETNFIFAYSSMRIKDSKWFKEGFWGIVDVLKSVNEITEEEFTTQCLTSVKFKFENPTTSLPLECYKPIGTKLVPWNNSYCEILTNNLFKVPKI